jgi:putative phage-type endonuclease
MNMEAPTLEKSAEWHSARKLGIGGSDAKAIMEGAWYDLWAVKTGRQESPDLSDNVAVQVGSWTEPLNIDFFERWAGKSVMRGMEPVVHSTHTFMRCNLDGWNDSDNAVVEAKHVSAWDKPDNVVSRYYPQLQHMMEVTGAAIAYLTVIYGNNKWEWYAVERDADYIAELIERERAFWWHVEQDEAPDNPDAVQASISLDDMREVDMTGNNQWADLAATWLDTRDAAKRFNDAEKDIKAQVEADVKLAHGHGIKVTRSKAGALSIREAK